MKFYKISKRYCSYLREQDSKVTYNSGIKERRPFVGVVLLINGFNYFAPLSSPKPKHKTMKNNIDFIKISGGEYGIINLNNMIPVNLKDAKEINFNTIDDKQYKELLLNQHRWCNSNKELISKKASKLYKLLLSDNANEKLVKRCCNIKLNEKRCLEYDVKNKAVVLY